MASAVLLLLHVPPDGVEPKLIVLPTHTDVGPVMAVGNGFTVNGVVTEHVVGKVYVIVTVPPRLPVTVPVVDTTDAVAGALLVQVPPDGVEPKVVL